MDETQRDPQPNKFEELKGRIPGWGSDSDPKNRPAVPKEKTPEGGTGAHWQEPERQIPKVRIHKSVEHRQLTPVFGSTCPPKGISGKLRDLAYRFSEGQSAHWLTLLMADRVDVIEGRIGDLMHGRLFNPIAESGLPAEWKRHGLRSRLGQRRADVGRLQKELLLAASVAVTTWMLVRNFRRGL